MDIMTKLTGMLEKTGLRTSLKNMILNKQDRINYVAAFKAVGPNGPTDGNYIPLFEDMKPVTASGTDIINACFPTDITPARVKDLVLC